MAPPTETDINKIVKAVKRMESLIPVVTHAIAKEVELKLEEIKKYLNQEISSPLSTGSKMNVLFENIAQRQGELVESTSDIALTSAERCHLLDQIVLILEQAAEKRSVTVVRALAMTIAETYLYSIDKAISYEAGRNIRFLIYDIVGIS